MKLQFDTTAKTIKIGEPVNIGELIEKLQMLLPNGQWKEYKLEVSVINSWTSPIIIETPIVYPNRPFWEYPLITYQSDTGYYNVQC